MDLQNNSGKGLSNEQAHRDHPGSRALEGCGNGRGGREMADWPGRSD